MSDTRFASMAWLSRTVTVAVCATMGLSAFELRAQDGPHVQSLTLQECIERALSANLDLQIERVAPEIGEWNIVNAQGAFDPALSGSLRYENMMDPLSPERAATLPYDTLKTQQLRSVLSLTGSLQTGTRYELSVFDTLTSGTLAPSGIHTGTSSLTLTQPLLKDFGRSNTVAIRVARKDRAIAIEQTAGRVMDIVSDVSRAYYELVFAIEDHAAKLEDLQRAKALLADNRTRVEVGVMSPLDVTQAEAGSAEREEAVIVSERAVIERENALKRLIASDVMTLNGVALRPAEALPDEPVATDAAESTRVALAGRPDLKQARHEVERRNLLRAFTRNQSLPEVNLETSYGLNARGDNAREFATNLSALDHPAWSVGLTATMPLGNRQADAAYRIARLEEERAGLTLRRLEQDIIVQVDNAVGQVQTNGKRVEATRVARRLAEESFKAEENKLRAGASTSFLVLQAQSQLAAARSAEIRARADLGASLVDLARVEGSTLQHHRIVLDE
jgi:outer membrane protein